MANTKSFNITKRMVYEAYKAVKASLGGAGIDKVSMQNFEERLADNLYKLWNRLASGSYFPQPVKIVEIPKSSGGTRKLGIPTIEDRIAQMVVKRNMEPRVDPYFDEDSYGYRPKKSALMAIEVTRRRCWQKDWVLEFDIKGLFDNIDHELLLKAVGKHTQVRWELLYIKRWLVCPKQGPDGTIVERTKGVPQGGVISPLLANLFMHYAFDKWMRRENPGVEICRYADDGLIHCETLEEAMHIREKLSQRLQTCKLELHPEKTKIVYCKDSNRKKEVAEIMFTFLGYTFMPRKAKARGNGEFTSFLPAISQAAQKRIRQDIRKWPLLKMHNLELWEIAKRYNPVIQGWLNYYGKYGKMILKKVIEHIDFHLVLWIKRKFKKYKRKTQKAWNFLSEIAKDNKELFAHWRVGIIPTTR